MLNRLHPSKWFTRGWTLQELIAPVCVIFFSNNWEAMGTRESLREELSTITGITTNVLMEPRQLSTVSIARRMSWAAQRHTTRREDIAYCLMGIFNVNMPLLYGEGDKAFMRLREEIIKDSEDQSLFAWQHIPNERECIEAGWENEGILAYHPIVFKDAYNIVPHPTDFPPSTVTSRGLSVFLPLYGGFGGDQYTAILTCHLENDLSRKIAITLAPEGNKYYRIKRSALSYVSHSTAESVKASPVYIHKWGRRQGPGSSAPYCYLESYPYAMYNFSGGVAVAANFPSRGRSQTLSAGLSDVALAWTKGTQSLQLPKGLRGHFFVLEFRHVDVTSSSSRPTDGLLSLVLKLFPKDYGIVAILPWVQEDLTSIETLRMFLDRHSDTKTISRRSVKIGKGGIHVGLEKTTKLFNRDTYVVTVDWKPFAGDPRDATAF